MNRCNVLRMGVLAMACLMMWFCGNISRANAGGFDLIDLTPDLASSSITLTDYLVEINNHGLVVFSGTEHASEKNSVLFASDGQSTWREFSAPRNTLGEFYVGSVNDGGVIAVRGRIPAGPCSVVVVDNGTAEAITPSARNMSLPSINNDGDVAYMRLDTHFVESATINMVNADGSNELIAGVDHGPFRSLWQSEPALNDSGTIASEVVLVTPFQGTVSVWNNGQPSFPLLVEGDNVDYWSVELNNNNELAYVAKRESDRYSIEVLRDNGTLDVLLTAGPDEAYWRLIAVGLADNGDAASYAKARGGVGSLMFHSSGETTTVLTTGDPLFGSTVESIRFNGAVNSNGQIAFGYTLANGAIGFARAQVVPEPNTLTLLLWGGVLSLVLDRRKRIGKCGPRIPTGTRRATGVLRDAGRRSAASVNADGNT